MIQPPADDIKNLAKTYPVPNPSKLVRRIGRLERMTQFYKDKAPDAPDKQSRMFIEFVSALLYAATTITMYRKLTTRLAEMADEEKE